MQPDDLAGHAFDAPHPDIEPDASGWLDVDGRHRLNWQTSGNPAGIPVVLLHGGPGGGSLAFHRRFFDPRLWWIVQFDQRGAGRSTPPADTFDNTTPHLVADIERLREHLAIERWVLFGGSWGSTLALAYAEAHPGKCLGLVLRGIFLARPVEIDWFMHGMGQIFPEARDAFAGFLPPEERSDLLGSYHRRLVDPDPNVHLPAAHAWDAYESACSTLLPPKAVLAPSSDTAALALARLEAHYFVNRGFMEEDQLLRDIGRIRHLPCSIVQGRYDIVCPAATAHALARAWPEAEFVVVPDAGHSVREPGITRALLTAVARMPTRLPTR